MIKITNNKEVKIVTKGAYDSFYKPLGFKIVEESAKTQKTIVEEPEKKVEETIKVDKVDEKPIKKSTNKDSYKNNKQKNK